MAGQPKRVLDDKEWKFLDSMTKAGCRKGDICTALECHENTLNTIIKREKDMTFEAYRKKNLGAGNAAILAAQHEEAVDKRVPSLLIWVGKQRCGQKDRHEVDNNHNFNHDEVRDSLDRKMARLAARTGAEEVPQVTH